MMAAAMSAAGASSDRRAGDSARSASHHAAAAATPTPACAVACSAPEETEPNGPKANAAAVSAPTVIDRVDHPPEEVPGRGRGRHPEEEGDVELPDGGDAQPAQREQRDGDPEQGVGVGEGVRLGGEDVGVEQRSR